MKQLRVVLPAFLLIIMSIGRLQSQEIDHTQFIGAWQYDVEVRDRAGELRGVEQQIVAFFVIRDHLDPAYQDGDNPEIEKKRWISAINSIPNPEHTEPIDGPFLGFTGYWDVSGANVEVTKYHTNIDRTMKEEKSLHRFEFSDPDTLNLVWDNRCNRCDDLLSFRRLDTSLFQIIPEGQGVAVYRKDRRIVTSKHVLELLDSLTFYSDGRIMYEHIRYEDKELHTHVQRHGTFRDVPEEQAFAFYATHTVRLDKDPAVESPFIGPEFLYWRYIPVPNNNQGVLDTMVISPSDYEYRLNDSFELELRKEIYYLYANMIVGRQ